MEKNTKESQKNRLLPRNIPLSRRKHKGDKRRTLWMWSCSDSQIRHSGSIAQTAWVSFFHLILNDAALMSTQCREEAEAPRGKRRIKDSMSYLTSLERTAAGAGVRHYNSRGLCMRKREGHTQKKGEVVWRANAEKCGMQCVSQKRKQFLTL